MRFIRSLGYACCGIRNFTRHEKNFRLQILAAAFTLSGGFYFRITSLEWIAVLICCAVVLSLEMINTSIEKLADHVCRPVHPDIKLVKDIAAGAVLLCSVFSLIIGMIIFFPKIKIMFFA